MARDDLDRQLLALRTDLTNLGAFVDDLLDRALTSVASGDAYSARLAQSREDEFDRATGTIEERMIALLTLQQPVLTQDLRLLVGALVVAQRLQRVGHGAFGVSRLAIDLAGFSSKEATSPQLLELGQRTRGMLQQSVAGFVQNDLATAEKVIAQKSAIDESYRTLRDELLASLSNVGTDTPNDEFAHRRLTFWLWIAHKLERVSDHAVVIAKRVQQL